MWPGGSLLGPNLTYAASWVLKNSVLTVQGALTLAKQCLQAAGVAGSVHLHQGACGHWNLPGTPDAVVTNPPWGRRLGGGRGQNSDFDDLGTEDEGAPTPGDEGADPGVDAWGAGTAGTSSSFVCQNVSVVGPVVRGCISISV